jgi:hypothetical protein
VVLDTKVNPWLTQTLKRVNRLKRPLNSVPQHTKCLTELLSGPSAIWNLCSILVPRAPESELEAHSNPLTDALSRFQFIHIQAYCVSIDMVMSNEIAYKLTPETISSLVEYHKDIYMIDQADATWQWTEKEAAIKTMHQDFVQAVNKYVFRTDKVALEGIEDDGSGDMLCGQSEEVRIGIMGLFMALLPPPPRIVEVRAPALPTIPSSPANLNWWAPTPPINSHIAFNPPVLPSNAPAMVSSPSPVSVTSSWLEDDFVADVAGSSVESPEALSAWWSCPLSPPPPAPTHLHFQPTFTTSADMMPVMGASCGGFGGGFGWETGRYVDFAMTM